jgi:hypothetical protein
VRDDVSREEGKERRLRGRVRQVRGGKEHGEGLGQVRDFSLESEQSGACRGFAVM